MERFATRHHYNPAARAFMNEFLKTEAEMAADFSFHTHLPSEEITRVGPPVGFPSLERTSMEDPIRLLMQLETRRGFEENY